MPKEPIEPINCEEQQKVLDAAMEAGHILLENGAEIFRVEETMDRICRHYGIGSGNFLFSATEFLQPPAMQVRPFMPRSSIFR